MRNKLLVVSGISLTLFLSACSSDNKYEKLMSKADKAMENMEVDKAMEYYQEILEWDPMDFEYGTSRQYIVEDLLADATSFKENLDYLQSITDEAKAAAEDIEFKPENTSAIVEAYSTIKSALMEVDDYPTTQMYKDLVDLDSHFTSETEAKVVSVLIEDIDKNIKDLKYDAAEESVELLSDIDDAFEGIVGEEVVSNYESTIESERERYVVFPTTYVKREHVLYEDANAGKITFMGEGQYDGEKVAYFKVEGDLQSAINEINIESRFILSNGTDRTASSGSTFNYKDYAIIRQLITEDTDVELARYDYMLNFLNHEDYQKITLKTSDGEGEIPAILRVKDEQTMKTSIKFEDSDKVIEFTHVVVDSDYIKLQGTVNAKKDIVLEEKVKLSLPGSGTFVSTTVEDTYYTGIAKNIEITLDPERSITNENPFAHIELFGQSYNLDLQTGNEVKGVALSLTDLFADSEDWDFEFEESYNEDEDAFYKDVAGKVYANVVAVSSYYDTPPVWNYQLNQKYASLKVDVGLDALTASEGYGSSKVTLLGDGNVLKTLTLAPGQATTTVDLNVSNVNSLEIQVEQTEGNDGYQRILFGNSVLTAK